MRTIAEEWADFDRRVVPMNASAIQRQEMKRSFYAGVLATMMSVKDLGAEDVSEEAGVAAMQKWEVELQAFYNGMVSGHE